MVEVRWVDSWNLQSGWHSRAKLRRDADDLPKQRTVGFVVAETRDTVVIASNEGQWGDYSAVTAIPRRSITRVREL